METAAGIWYNALMPIVDIIKRIFSSGDAGFPVPPRLCKDRMAVCVQEARQIADDTARRTVEFDTVNFSDPAFDTDRVCDEPVRGVLCSPVAPLEAGEESRIPLSPKPLEPQRRVPPRLNAPVLSFSALLLTYVNEKCGGMAPMAYKRAGVSRQVYSRIISFDDSSVDKQTAMLFCIGLQLTMSESELLLKSAGYAFSDTIPTDMLFSYCIKNGIWNLKDVNALFAKCKLPPVTRSRNPYK